MESLLGQGMPRAAPAAAKPFAAVAQPAEPLAAEPQRDRSEEQVSDEDQFKFFYEVFKGRLPTDLVQAVQAASSSKRTPWLTAWAPLFPFWVGLKYGPIRDLFAEELSGIDANSAISPQMVFKALQRTATNAQGVDLQQWVAHYGKGVSRCLGFLVFLREMHVVSPPAWKPRWPKNARVVTLGRANAGQGQGYALLPFGEPAMSAITAFMNAGIALRESCVPRPPRTLLDYGEAVRLLMRKLGGRTGYVRR